MPLLKKDWNSGGSAQIDDNDKEPTIRQILNALLEDAGVTDVKTFVAAHTFDDEGNPT